MQSAFLRSLSIQVQRMYHGDPKSTADFCTPLTSLLLEYSTASRREICTRLYFVSVHVEVDNLSSLHEAYD